MPVLLLLTIASCKTTEYQRSDFPDFPQRKEISPPESIEDLGLIISYYEQLLQEWESWGVTFCDVMEYHIPEEWERYIKEAK